VRICELAAMQHRNKRLMRELFPRFAHAQCAKMCHSPLDWRLNSGTLPRKESF